MLYFHKRKMFLSCVSVKGVLGMMLNDEESNLFCVQFTSALHDDCILTNRQILFNDLIFNG